MQTDRERWNTKHRQKHHRSAACELLRRFAPLARKGRAFDIATGTGANALHLAGLGFAVDAVDISDAALRGFAAQHPQINAVCADLDHFNIAGGRYTLIANIRYLNRRLFPYIVEGLTPGGMLIFETYLEDPTVATFQPSCRDYLLRPNELLHAFLGLQIIYYRELPHGRENEPGPLASLVALKT